MCENDICFDSHCSYVRRSPFNKDGNLLYLPIICPQINSEIDTKSMSQDTDKNCIFKKACCYCHSMEELNYHPMVYKTTLCPHITLESTCKAG